MSDIDYARCSGCGETTHIADLIQEVADTARHCAACREVEG